MSDLKQLHQDNLEIIRYLKSIHAMMVGDRDGIRE